MKKKYNKPDFLTCELSMNDTLMASGDGVQENKGTIGDLLDGESNPWVM